MKKTITILTLFILSFSLSLNHIYAKEADSRKLREEKSFYISTDEVHPGQIRYSDSVVKQKVKEHIEAGKASWDPETQSWILMYADNTCLFPLSKALPVVNSPNGYVLVDGHHHYMTNLSFDGSTFPITVIADLSDMTSQEFQDYAEQKGWIHPYDVFGNKINLPKSFKALKNDPNRNFATLCKRSIKDPNHPEKSTGVDYPIWLKVGTDIPFIEMKISEALWNEGLVYQNHQNLKQYKKFYEKARLAISEANIPGLRVIPTKTHYQDIDLYSFVSKENCA